MRETQEFLSIKNSDSGSTSFQWDQDLTEDFEQEDA